MAEMPDNPRARAVLSRLLVKPESAKALVDVLGLGAREVERVLVELTLEGLIERDSQGRFRLMLSDLTDG